MPSLGNLLNRVPCDTGTVQTHVSSLVAILDTPTSVRFEGASMPRTLPYAMGPRGGVQYLTQTMLTAVVPILEFSSLEAVESMVGRALVMGAGGRSVEVHAWEHLPPHTTSLWSGRATPQLVLIHPKTYHEVYLACQTYVSRPWSMPESPASVCGAEVLTSADIPEDTTVWIADRQAIGTLYLRQMATPTFPHYRVGILLNAGGLAVIHKTKPPKLPPKNSWDRILRDDFLDD